MKTKKEVWIIRPRTIIEGEGLGAKIKIPDPSDMIIDRLNFDAVQRNMEYFKKKIQRYQKRFSKNFQIYIAEVPDEYIPKQKFRELIKTGKIKRHHLGCWYISLSRWKI